MTVEVLDDVTGDGHDEVIVGSWENAVIILNGLTGAQVWKTTVGILNGGDVWYLHAIDDLNADGFQDVVAGSFDTYAYAMDGTDGTVLWSYPTGNRVYSIYPVGDLNGDFTPEVAIGNQNPSYGSQFLEVIHVLDASDVPAAPDFTLAVDPGLVQICAGDNAEYTVTVGAINGFASPVGLAATGNPAGSTTAFIGKLLARISDSLEEQVGRFQSLRNAIAVKEKELQELYGIEKTAASFAALLEAQNKKREEFDTEMATRKEELRLEIESTRLEWVREKKDYEAKTKERDAEEKRKRDREKEEFEYGFVREKQLARDKFEDGIQKTEKEIQTRKEQVERELVERERAVAERERVIAEREGDLRELEKKVAGFPKEMDAAVSHAVKDTTEKITLSAKNREELLKKEFEGERNVLTTRIEALQAESAYPELWPGAVATNLTPFTLKVAKAVPCGTLIELTHTTMADGFGFTNTFTAVVGQIIATNWGTNSSESADVPKAIPDPGVTLSTNEITETGRILEFEVSLRANHTWYGDLEFALEHPDGTRVVGLTSGSRGARAPVPIAAAAPARLGRRPAARPRGAWHPGPGRRCALLESQQGCASSDRLPAIQL